MVISPKEATRSVGGSLEKRNEKFGSSPEEQGNQSRVLFEKGSGGAHRNRDSTATPQWK